MDDLKELLVKAKIIKKDDRLTLLPNGIFIWNSIVSYLKDKFNKLSYSEIYTNSLEYYIQNEKKLPSEHFSLSYLKDKIEFVSYGKYTNEIEECRNKTIDVLEIYNCLGKDLFAIPFLCGKDPFNEDNNLLTTYFGEKNIASNYLGECDSSFLTCSKIDTDILYTLINIHKDEKGLVFSPKIAPIQIEIIPLKPNEKGVLKECRKISDLLLEKGYRVYLNEKNITSKEKKENSIINGVSLIVEIGPRDLERGVVEITCRDNLEELVIDNDKLVNEIESLFKKMHKRMYLKVLEKNISLQYKVINLDELHNNINDKINNIVRCGNKDCLKEIKDLTNFISFNQQLHSSNCPFCLKKGKHVVSIIKKN